MKKSPRFFCQLFLWCLFPHLCFLHSSLLSSNSLGIVSLRIDQKMCAKNVEFRPKRFSKGMKEQRGFLQRWWSNISETNGRARWKFSRCLDSGILILLLVLSLTCSQYLSVKSRRYLNDQNLKVRGFEFHLPICSLVLFNHIAYPIFKSRAYFLYDLDAKM